MEYICRDFENNQLHFSFSYNKIREEYLNIKNYSNEQFLTNLKEILHTTMLICYIKEIPTYICLSDTGILHELIHLINEVETCHRSLDLIRNMWNNTCRL